MMDGPIPQNYEEWHHCITVECSIPLTQSFVEERIASLNNAADFKTRQFVELYGSQHHQNVLAWFEQAKQHLSNK